MKTVLDVVDRIEELNREITALTNAICVLEGNKELNKDDMYWLNQLHTQLSKHRSELRGILEKIPCDPLSLLLEKTDKN